MENDTDKLVRDQLATLPQNLQRAIAAVPWKTLVQQIGRENGLNSDQLESLEQETMFIIHGFEPLENYISNLIREIKISEEVATTIAERVAEKILDYIAKEAEGFEKAAKASTEPRPISSSLPEVKPDIHPMIESGETVHNVKPLSNISNAKPKLVETPNYNYSKGKDPYREPLV